MMVSEQRQASRLRVTKAQIAMLEAFSTVPGLTRVETMKAMTEMVNNIQNDIFIEANP